MKTYLLWLLYNATVFIQPMGNVDHQSITTVKQSIENVYGFKCVVLKTKAHDQTLYATSGTRYDAQKIVNRYRSSDVYTIVITDKDIAYYKSAVYPEYGIIGLATFTGKSCVVSTHRINNTALKDRFLARLSKVSVHEIGHTLGLPHCKYDSTCFMSDARGTVKTIDNEKLQLCKRCKHRYYSF